MKPESSKKLLSKKNKNIYFRIWLAVTIFTVLLLTIIATAWTVRHAMLKGPNLSEGQTKVVLTIASFPGLARKALIQLPQIFFSDPVPLLINRKDVEKPYWIRRFPAPEDTGYLLLSGVDPLVKHSIVKLIRIADGKEIARWDPDWKIILARSTNKKYAPIGSIYSMQPGYPILLETGDIIFNNECVIVQLSPNQSKPVWVLDKVSHHSIEIDANGDIWTPSVSDRAFLNNPCLHDNLRDDSLAKISPDGRLLENHSFSEILLKNGLRELLLGTTENIYRSDPIHMNQISVAPSNSRYWKKGDLLISARNLSSIFLYRPSTGKIIWNQQGPWMNQHSARFVDDHRISVFSNNVLKCGIKSEYCFVTPGEINQVFIYDFATKEATQPFKAMLDKAKPVTKSGGVVQVLSDGGLYIEETDYGRHLRFTKDRLLWSRVNDYNTEYIGSVSWSRYLTAEEVKLPLRNLEVRKCRQDVANVKK